MSETKFLTSQGRVILEPGDKAMVAFPDGWVFMELQFEKGDNPFFRLITIRDGKMHKIQLRSKGPRSAEIKSGNPSARTIRIREIIIPDDNSFVSLDCSPPRDLL